MLYWTPLFLFYFFSFFFILYCTILCCAILYCTVLYCTVIFLIDFCCFSVAPIEHRQCTEMKLSLLSHPFILPHSHLPTYLSDFLSMHLSTHLPKHLSMYLFSYLPISLSPTATFFLILLLLSPLLPPLPDLIISLSSISPTPRLISPHPPHPSPLMFLTPLHQPSSTFSQSTKPHSSPHAVERCS